MATLIGEVNNHEVGVEVDSSTFIAFNEYIKTKGRLRTKKRFIGEIFVAIKKEDKDLNEESVKQYLSENSTKQPAQVS